MSYTSVHDFMNFVSVRNKGEAEFLQAVEEVVESIWGFLQEHPHYKEARILDLIARGKSNKQIAATVFLAEGTVKNYVSTIMAKLHANDRTQAAVFALKRGLAKLE